MASDRWGTQFPLFESVSYRWGYLENASEHQRRYERGLATLSHYLGVTLEPRSLADFLDEAYDRWERIHQPDLGSGPRPGQVKGRIPYGATLGSPEFMSYRPALYEKAALVPVKTLDYDHKWTDRRELEFLVASLDSSIYPIFVVDGWIADGLTSNVVVKRGNRWLTPRNPLLPGTQRSKLLEAGVLTPTLLTEGDFQDGEEIYLINALNRLGEWKLRCFRK